MPAAVAPAENVAAVSSCRMPRTGGGSMSQQDYETTQHLYS